MARSSPYPRLVTPILKTRGRGATIAAVLALVAFGLALAAARGEIAAGGETARASKTATVKIEDFAFRPATLKIAPGSKVVFSNTGGVTHTATRDGGFDTGRIRPGKTATVSFKQKGTFRYHCTIHSSMRGKIVVD